VHFRDYGTQNPGTGHVEERKTVAFETLHSRRLRSEINKILCYMKVYKGLSFGNRNKTHAFSTVI